MWLASDDDDAHIAEWILTLVVDPERAAATVGDLLDRLFVTTRLKSF